jgi:decaprenylphospho-beta-D-erythro-pentofuranosid-2-ulose 2-reductase
VRRQFSHAIVVGASSGIGEALVRRLVEKGCRVAAVARREGELARLARELEATGGFVLPVVHDVERVAEVPELLQEAARTLGGLDLVVYAAGVIHRVDPAGHDTEGDLHMLSVNLGGAVAWLNPVAERFGLLGRGTIVGIASVAGDRGRHACPVYNASKAGLASYLEGLRNRVARHGVRVVTIKPGFVDTAMTRGMPRLLWLISADRAAGIILRKAERGVVCAYVPARWRALMWVIRCIPSVIFRRLKV